MSWYFHNWFLDGISDRDTDKFLAELTRKGIILDKLSKEYIGSFDPEFYLDYLNDLNEKDLYLLWKSAKKVLTDFYIEANEPFIDLTNHFRICSNPKDTMSAFMDILKFHIIERWEIKVNLGE